MRPVDGGGTFKPIALPTDSQVTNFNKQATDRAALQTKLDGVREQIKQPTISLTSANDPLIGSGSQFTQGVNPQLTNLRAQETDLTNQISAIDGNTSQDVQSYEAVITNQRALVKSEADLTAKIKAEQERLASLPGTASSAADAEGVTLPDSLSAPQTTSPELTRLQGQLSSVQSSILPETRTLVDAESNKCLQPAETLRLERGVVQAYNAKNNPSSADGYTAPTTSPVPPPDAPPPGSTPQPQTVQSGDTLWAIAKKALTDQGQPTDNASVTKATDLLFTTNKKSLRSGNPDLIFPGEKYVIPDYKAENGKPPDLQTRPMSVRGQVYSV